MHTASQRTLHTLEQIVKSVPIGTNLALLQLIWALITGAFIPARGSVHMALSLAGFAPSEIRRSWAALRYGVWDVQELLLHFRTLVVAEQQWQAHEYEGYRPLSVDLTAIWRPQIKGWSGKLYRQLIGKSFLGIGFGLIAEVGHIEGHRLPLLKAIVRAPDGAHSEDTLKKKTLRKAAHLLREKQVLIHDAGVTLKQVHEEHVARFVIRLSCNCTGRRPQLPPYKGIGARPKKGILVRPLERVFKGNTLAATSADVTTTFILDGRQVTAYGWHGLMRSDLHMADPHELFSVWVIDDPMFEGVLVLGTNLPTTVSPQTIYQLYIDRWPIEQIPLVAKQMLGCHRQFVFAHTSCWRLGELAFFVGNVLTWLAATSPPLPSGYWDRHPKKRLGGYDAIWRALIFQKRCLFPSEFEKSAQLPPIYPRESKHIGVAKLVKRRFDLILSPYC